MELYEKSGYLNMPEIIDSGPPFIFIAAARGTGKTYGALKHYTAQRRQIMLLRRTQNEADLQLDHDSSSFLEPMDDLDEQYYIEKKKSVGMVMLQDDPEDFPLAFVAALSTFANVRGSFNFQRVTDIFYDEFICEPHVRKIKNEGMALANLYESVNRNRELSGRDPVKLVCAANSVNMANDIFLYFNLIQDAEQMLASGEDMRLIGNKLLIIPQRSPVSMKKSKTALYQAVDKEFSDMAIKNKFILNDFSYVGRRNLRDYELLFNAGLLYFYRHKADNIFYVTQTFGQTKNRYGSGYAALEKLRRDKWRWPALYLDGMIYFDSYQSIVLFEKYFDLS